MTAKRIRDNLTPFSIFVAIFSGLSWYVPLTIKQLNEILLLWAKTDLPPSDNSTL